MEMLYAESTAIHHHATSRKRFEPLRPARALIGRKDIIPASGGGVMRLGSQMMTRPREGGEWIVSSSVLDEASQLGLRRLIARESEGFETF